MSQVSMSSFHGPLAARCRVVSSGKFASIEIGKFPISVDLMLVGTTAENLHFLYDLREAVEKAFRYELEK